MFTKLILSAAVLVGVSTGAMAQDCLGQADFDSCVMGFVGQQQAALAQGQQQTMAAYMEEFGPMLQQQYPAYASQMTFEQFAYWMMMTANGANIQGGLNNQRDVNIGLNDANKIAAEGGEDYIAGNNANSDNTFNTLENYDRTAVRGNVQEVNPMTGETVELPYSDQPYNQPFDYNGQSYMNTENGYQAWNGNGWEPTEAPE